MNRVTNGAEEYRRLSDALADVTTPCSNDWRFIQERNAIDQDDVTAMRQGCARCPLAGLCRDYATAARPSAGMWAGRFWGRRERRTTAGGEA